MSHALRPIVQRARRRHSLAVPLIATSAAVAIVLVGVEILALPLAEPRTVIVPTPAHDRAIVVPMPVALAFEPPTPPRPACPAEATELAAVKIAHLPEAVDEVSPAPSNARWIAAWNAKHLFVSTDGGASFTRVLDGPTDVLGATFDCFGHVIALRSGQVGVVDGERERWHATGAQLVVGGGPDIVTLGSTSIDRESRAQIGLSSDLGATWRYHEGLGYAVFGVRFSGRQSADGSVRVTGSLADCMNDELFSFTLRGDKLDTDRIGAWESAAYARYGDRELSNNSWRHIGDDTWTPITGLPDASGRAYRPLPGPYPIVADDTALFRIRKGAAQELPIHAIGEAKAVDAAGRIWCIADGQPVLAR